MATVKQVQAKIKLNTKKVQKLTKELGAAQKAKTKLASDLKKAQAAEAAKKKSAVAKKPKKKAAKKKAVAKKK